MTQTHPLTPSDELLEHWRVIGYTGNWQNALTLAYRAGAEMEFEASYEWLFKHELGPSSLTRLRDARRPKAPTLKELALDELDRIPTHDNEGRTVGVDVSIIRRAVEALDG